MQRRIVLIGMLIGVLCAARPGAGAPPNDVTAPPRDDQALADLIDATARELQAVDAAAQPASEAATTEPVPFEAEMRAAAAELSTALKNYLERLKKCQTLRAQVQMLKTEQAVAQFTDELAKIKEKTQQVKNQPMVSRRTVSDEQFDALLQQTQQQLDEAASDLQARLDNQAKRNEDMARFDAEKEGLQKQLQDSKAALIEVQTESEAALQVAGSDAERTLANYQLRLAQVNAAKPAVDLDILELEQQRRQKQADQAERRLPLLREWVTELQNRLGRLQKIRSRTEIQDARDNCEYYRANPEEGAPFQREGWCLLLDILTAREKLRAITKELGFHNRFDPEDKQDLVEQIQIADDVWNQFVESLDRRPGAQIKERVQLIKREILAWQQARRELHDLTDQTFDDRFEIGAQIDQATDDIRPRYRSFERLKQPAGVEEDFKKLRVDLETRKSEFSDACEAALGELEALSQRLRESLGLVQEHLTELAAIESTLYWSYLSIADTTLWKFSYTRAVEEWNLEAERRQRGQNWAAIRAGFGAVRPAAWTVVGVLLVTVVAAAQFLRTRLFRKADALESRITERLQKEPGAYADLSDRLHINALRFIARTSLVLWPCILAYLFAHFSPLDGRALQTAALFAMAVSVADGIIRAAFRTAKPRFRLLTCSNVVAKYYRRRLRWLLATSVILVPVPLLLNRLDSALYVRQYMWALYLIVILLQLLWFLLNKHLVLKVVGRREEQPARLMPAIVSQVYPVLPLLVSALIVAQVLGYRALVIYILFGVAATMATLLVARLLWRYLAECISKIGHIEQAAEGDRPPGDAATEEEERDALVISRDLLLFVVRWTVVASTAVLILQYWGLHWRQLYTLTQLTVIPGNGQDRPPVTLGRIGLAVLIVFAGMLLSRGLRAMLHIKIEAGQSAVGAGGRIALAKLIHYFMLCFGLYFALAIMRIPLGAITVVLGTLGLGIGLGLQPIFVNFISGLIMLLERHLNIGDRVEVNGVLGQVTELGIRSTTIKTFDNVDMVIPNADFINSTVVNWTLKEDTLIRGKLNVGVSYASDVRLVQRLLLQVASESPLVLPNPAPRVYFLEFGASSLDFSLYVWFKDSPDRWEFLMDSRFRVLELFREHGVEIPFPQRTLSTVGDQPLRVQVEPPPQSLHELTVEPGAAARE